MIPNRKRWRKHTVTIDSMTIEKFSVKFLGGKRNVEFMIFLACWFNYFSFKGTLYSISFYSTDSTKSVQDFEGYFKK